MLERGSVNREGKLTNVYGRIFGSEIERLAGLEVSQCLYIYVRKEGTVRSWRQGALAVDTKLEGTMGG